MVFAQPAKKKKGPISALALVSLTAAILFLTVNYIVLPGQSTQIHYPLPSISSATFVQSPIAQVTTFASRMGMAPFVKTGAAVEIGVYDGEFAAVNLQSFTGKYYMVDYKIRPKLQERVDKWMGTIPGRTFMIQSKSVEAASKFDDLSLDWVYIDATHRYKNVLEDMDAWYPKLKAGGLFSGHDYCAKKADRVGEYAKLPWCGIYEDDPDRKKTKGDEKDSMKESARAVLEWAEKHGLEVRHTMEGRKELSESGPDSKNPSWYFFKPVEKSSSS